MALYKYSKTSNERKQRQPKPKVTASAAVTEAGEVAAIEPAHSKKSIIIIVALVSAIVMLLTAALVLIFATKKLDTDNPVAEMRLSNGVVLRFELYYNITPITVSSFVYLANNGYYDDTAIHRSSKNYSDGGYYKTFITPNSSSNISLRIASLNAKFKYTIKNEFDKSPYSNNVFGYLSTAQQSNYGTVFPYFRFCFTEDSLAPSSELASNGISTLISGTVFGYAYGQETLDNLKKMRDIEIESATNTPLVPLKVVKVKILANDKKWRNYDFYSDHVKDTDYYVSNIS